MKNDPFIKLNNFKFMPFVDCLYGAILTFLISMICGDIFNKIY